MDWIAGGLGLWAKYLLGRRSRWGWIVSFLNCIAGLSLVVKYKLWGLLVTTILNMGLSAYYFGRWSGDEEN